MNSDWAIVAVCLGLTIYIPIFWRYVESIRKRLDKHIETQLTHKIGYICTSCDRVTLLNNLSETHDPTITKHPTFHALDYRCSECNEKLVKKAMKELKYSSLRAVSRVYNLKF